MNDKSFILIPSCKVYGNYVEMFYEKNIRTHFLKFIIGSIEKPNFGLFSDKNLIFYLSNENMSFVFSSNSGVAILKGFHL